MPTRSPDTRTLNRQAFQATLHGQSVDLYTLNNAQGAFAKVCNYGARVVQLVMPNAQGECGDVALGFDDLAGLKRPSPAGVPSMGAFIGRYANRIAHGRFSLDGVPHLLPPNSGPHSIHGGPGGSRYAVFAATQTAGNQLELRHCFTPHSDGFPGSVALTVTYTLRDDNALSIAWQATAVDAPTVASFTSHVFFNLSGDFKQAVDAHVLQLYAANYLPLQADLTPTGQIQAVKGTPFDFRQPKPIGADLHSAHPQNALCGGYDHHFALDGWDAGNQRLMPVACVSEARSGRVLRVFSTEPGVQLFTANGLDQAQCGFGRHSALCLEPSYFPDSPNQPGFPSTRLAPGHTRHGQIVYAFGIV